MKIRTRLTIRFVLIVAGIITMFSSGIFYFASLKRENDFNRRLKNRALTTARLLVDIKEVDHELLEIIEKNTVNALIDEKLTIYNSKDSLIYHHEEDGGEKITVSNELMANIKSEDAVYFKNGATQMVGISYKGKYGHYVLVSSARDEAGLMQIAQLKLILIIGGGFSILITGIFGWLFARQVLQPISNMIRQVDSITASNLNKRLGEGKQQDELELLAVTFNKMLDRLYEAFEIRKRFVANASHEFRTPLTAMSSQLEVTLMSERDNVEYKRVLESVLDEVRKLNLLTNGMLKMAQMHPESNDLRIKPVRIDELLWSMKEDLKKVQPDYSMQIEFTDFPEDEDKIQISGNEPLLKTAILNIVDNACKYSEDKKVLVKASFTDTIKLSFSDNGIGIPKKDLKNIFQPFYRAENTTGTAGHGLGLSLAERIIKMHNGSIAITSQVGKGTEVQVDFAGFN